MRFAAVACTIGAMADFVHFVSVPGKAQARFGSSQFLGCKLDRASGKLIWSEDPVPIGTVEHRKHLRDYANAVRRGDLQAVSVETLDDGRTKVTVLPGGPAPSAKNGLQAAGTSWVIGEAQPAMVAQVAPPLGTGATLPSVAAIETADEPTPKRDRK